MERSKIGSGRSSTTSISVTLEYMTGIKKKRKPNNADHIVFRRKKVLRDHELYQIMRYLQRPHQVFVKILSVWNTTFLEMINPKSSQADFRWNEL
ncbi:hypothetical protein QE152_g15849 [Popillia japonica]|uniref:Uncharacterized protein n=1 Tax=Popillia japonica TaxID=7064 RepID=A0AAW1L6Y0_POPJA